MLNKWMVTKLKHARRIVRNALSQGRRADHCDLGSRSVARERYGPKYEHKKV